jgi:hypothetical protein
LPCFTKCLFLAIHLIRLSMKIQFEPLQVEPFISAVNINDLKVDRRIQIMHYGVFIVKGIGA